MNENVITFIICVNNAQKYEEAVFYLEQLELPEGITKEIIAVQEAESMAAGYQAAMKSSEAKYKVYMHQDVLICQNDFIQKLIQIFQSNREIGMVGMIGRRELQDKLYVASDWDVGNIYFNGANPQLCCQEYDEWPMQVDAVDGLLIATQYDINWREDLFDGWDFYDISQCMEFKRAGYQIVVPYQETPWCFHDNYYSRLNHYFKYQKIFCEEYQDIRKYENMIAEHPRQEMEELQEGMQKNLQILVNNGKKQELWEIFQKMNGNIHMGLRDFFVLAQIEHLEMKIGMEKHFWEENLSWEELQKKIFDLKYKLKRMEFGRTEFGQEMQKIQKEYTVVALAIVTLQYASEKEEIRKRIKQWYMDNQWIEQQTIWEWLTNE